MSLINSYKAYLVDRGLAASGDVGIYDLVGQLAVARAEIEGELGYQLVSTGPSERRFELPRYGWRTLEHPPLLSIHQIEISDRYGETGWILGPAEYAALPLHGPPYWRTKLGGIFIVPQPIDLPLYSVAISGDWGLAQSEAELPADLVRAVCVVASRIIIDSSTDMDSIKLGQDTFSFARRLTANAPDPDAEYVRRVLTRYKWRHVS